MNLQFISRDFGTVVKYGYNDDYDQYNIQTQIQ